MFFRTPNAKGLNDSGELLFKANITNIPGGNGVSLWTERSGFFSLVAKEGDVPPGFDVSDNPFVEFFDPQSFNSNAFNNSGDVDFVASVTGIGPNGGGSGTGLWSKRGDTPVRLVAFEGGAAPGSNGDVYSSLFSISGINNSGQTLFSNSLSSGNGGIWAYSLGVPDLIAQRGQTLDGENGLTFNFISEPSLNDTGQAVFSTSFQTENAGGLGKGIFLSQNGSIQSVAQTGDVAFGIDADATLGSSIAHSEISELGQVAFTASLVGDEIDETNDSGVWLTNTNSGETELLARKGDVARGADASFDGFADTLLNNEEEVAVLGFLSGPNVTPRNQTGLFMSNGADLELIARTNDSVVQGADVKLLNFQNVIFNNEGQLAFFSDLFRGTVAGGDLAIIGKGLFVTDLSGELIPVAREGEAFDVDDNPLVEDLRIVQFVQRGIAFLNDAGQLAFTLEFTDGTGGIFVANIISQPTSQTTSFAAGTSLGNENLSITNTVENSNATMQEFLIQKL